MTKMKLMGMLNDFQTDGVVVIKTDDKMSLDIETYAGKAEAPAGVVKRIENLAVGCTILARQIGTEVFSNWLPKVQAEYNQNRAVFDRILKDDASITIYRKSAGKHVPATCFDLRSFLDMLPGLSVGGSITATEIEDPTEVEWE